MFAMIVPGCSTFEKSLRIDNASQPYSQIRQAALNALPIGLSSSSPNGRELISKHFIYKGKGEFAEAVQNDVRQYAKITINGSRRPYTIEITVLKEVKIDSSSGGAPQYRMKGYDLRLANLVKTRMEAELAKRREDLNIIDDFRVF